MSIHIPDDDVCSNCLRLKCRHQVAMDEIFCTPCFVKLRNMRSFDPINDHWSAPRAQKIMKRQVYRSRDYECD